MTANQIRYLELQETARANRAKEMENERSNRVKETETQRSDLAKEAEAQRSNMRQEELKEKDLEFSKYGNSLAGGTVRTIKAAGEDAANVTKNIVSSLNESIGGSAKANEIAGSYSMNEINAKIDELQNRWENSFGSTQATLFVELEKWKLAKKRKQQQNNAETLDRKKAQIERKEI